MSSSRSDKQASDRRLYAWLIPVGAVYLALAGWYAHFTPFGQAPDESAHLPYVAHLVEHRSLPVFRPGEGSYEFHQPPLFYALAAPAYVMSSPANHYKAVRWVNIVLGLGVIWAAFALMREVFPKRPSLAIASAALVAFLPMHVALCASVTNDIPGEVLAGWTLVVCAQGIARGWSAPRAALAGGLVGLGWLTKSGTVPLIAIAWLAIFLYHNRAPGPAWKPMLVNLSSFTIVAMIVGGWWLVRNQLLYGDPLALRVFLAAFRGSPKPQDFFAGGMTLTGYMQFVAWWTFRSFWGVFGNMDVFMPKAVYIVLEVLCAVSAAGAIRFLLGWSRLELQQRQALLVLGFAALVQVVLFIRFNMHFFQAQARYLYPALPVWAMLLCLGTGEWAGKKKWFGEMLPAAAALIVAAIAPWLWIMPGLPR